MNRRRVLLGLTAAVGAIGAAFAAVPFVRYLLPSDRAKALGAPISIDLSALQPGVVKAYQWRGQPILVMRRTPEQIEALELSKPRLLDDKVRDNAQPGYVDLDHRARKPEFLVLLGNCTHLGCVPSQDVATGRSLLGNWWPGGFHCPCHDSLYDYAGRVVRGPAPANLRVPPHRFVSDKTLIVGEDSAPA